MGIKEYKSKTMEKRFFNVQELTEHINMSESYVYKKVSSNQIPFLNSDQEPYSTKVKLTHG